MRAEKRLGGGLCLPTGGLPMCEKVHKLSNNPGKESLRTKVSMASGALRGHLAEH